MKSALSGLAVLSLFLITGCGSGGGSRAEVKGKVIFKGQPLTMLKDETIHVSLIQIEAASVKDQLAGGGTLQEDGTFVVRFPEGRDIIPGKYRVALNSDIYGAEAKEEGKQRFANFDSDNSPLIVELSKDSGQGLLVDLSKQTVSKQ